MITTNNLNKLKNYIGIAARGGYIVWGTDNLNGYTHKLFLVVYRKDFGKTIEKTIKWLDDAIPKVMLEIEDFNNILMTDKCKIFGIKNKGLADQIYNLLRGENG